MTPPGPSNTPFVKVYYESLDLVVLPLSAVGLSSRKRIDSLAVSLVEKVLAFVVGAVIPDFFAEAGLLAVLPAALVAAALDLD